MSQSEVEDESWCPRYYSTFQDASIHPNPIKDMLDNVKGGLNEWHSPFNWKKHGTLSSDFSACISFGFFFLCLHLHLSSIIHLSLSLPFISPGVSVRMLRQKASFTFLRKRKAVDSHWYITTVITYTLLWPLVQPRWNGSYHCEVFSKSNYCKERKKKRKIHM